MPAKKLKLPRKPCPRLMYVNEEHFIGENEMDLAKHADPSDDRMWTLPVAVIPCATVKQARGMIAMAKAVQTCTPMQIKQMLAAYGYANLPTK